MTEEELLKRDMAIHGMCITLDGKRIDPEDFYLPPDIELLDITVSSKATSNS